MFLRDKISFINFRNNEQILIMLISIYKIKNSWYILNIKFTSFSGVLHCRKVRIHGRRMIDFR